MVTLLRQLARDESGQDLIEYALVSGFITMAVVLAATNLGVAVDTIFTDINTEVTQIPGG